MLRQAWEGYNACLFAYGQTGAGKSWSITGSHEQPGIIPLFCNKLFYFMQNHPIENTELSVECSFLEIYNERVQDLLNPDGTNLKVREHPITGVFVEGLSYCAVDCYDDVEVLMDEGTAARTIGATNMNASSSRSHSIFEIVITQEYMDPFTKSTSEKQSRVVLVDLAGSERAGSTGATGTRLKEGAQINKSLSALGQCIRGLADAANKGGAMDLKKVPFRNSVLTMLLKNSLAGNAKTTMLCAISPAGVNYSESMSTLRYAQSAKKIATKAVVNEDPTAKLIKQLREEVERLKNEVATGGGGSGAAVMEVEAMMMQKSMSKEQRKEQTNRLKARRKCILAMTGGGSMGEEGYKKFPHLSNLNQDPLLSGTLKLIIADGTTMKIGRRDADVAQDVQLEGLGMKKSHCLISNEGGGVLFVRVGEPQANVYVNGVKLGEEGAQLRHGDILVLGVCTHIYQLIIPDAVADEEEERPSEITNRDDTTVSYQTAVRQVVLGRPETEHQRMVRLAHLVIATWRRPVFRRMFEERLVEALRYCQEANEISKLMHAKIQFNINLSCGVRLDDAASLSLREIIKYEHLNINVRAHRVPEEALQLWNLDASADKDANEETRLFSSKDWLMECGRVAFGEFLDGLRNVYDAMKPLCVLWGGDGEGDGENRLLIGPGEEDLPAVVHELFSKTDQVTLDELFAHLQAVPSQAMDVNRDSLTETVGLCLDDDSVKGNTTLRADEVKEVVNTMLSDAFEDSMQDLMDEFGRHTGGGGISLEELQIYKDKLLEIVGSGGDERKNLLLKMGKGFEVIKEKIGGVVDVLGEDAEEKVGKIKEIEVQEEGGMLQQQYQVIEKFVKGGNSDNAKLRVEGGVRFRSSALEDKGEEVGEEVEEEEVYQDEEVGKKEVETEQIGAKETNNERELDVIETAFAQVEVETTPTEKIEGEGEISAFDDSAWGVESQAYELQKLESIEVEGVEGVGADEEGEAYAPAEEEEAFGLQKLESIEVEGVEGVGADEEGAAYAPAEEEEHANEPPQVDDGLPHDWSLVHDEGSNQEFWWSEARQESRWAVESVDVPTDDGEYEEHEENEEHGQEQEIAVADIVYEQEGVQELERGSSSLSKPVLDFDDLSDDHFDLDGELPQTDEFHVYDSADEAAKALEEEPSKEESIIDDWKLIVDEDTGRDYWWSESRDEAKWVDEEEDDEEEHGDGGEKGEVADKDGFELHEDAEGRQYLFNPETGESEWL